MNFILKECKKLGNTLIIGINSDESIKRLKGSKRPINKLEDRINFLRELNRSRSGGLKISYLFYFNRRISSKGVIDPSYMS
jgi:cytidyltransferase-like protein